MRRFPARAKLSVVSKVPRPVLGPTQPTIQLVAGSYFLRVKRPGPEVDHSPLVLRLRISGAIPPLLHMPSLRAQETFSCLMINTMQSLIDWARIRGGTAGQLPGTNL